MFYRLVTMTPPQIGGPRSRTLRLPATIGRDPDKDVSINHDSVSRTHCRLALNGEGVLTVQDLNSMNGTYVDDQKIQRSELHPGEILQVGAVRFRVEYGSDTDHGNQNEPEPVYELSETVPMKTVQRPLSTSRKSAPPPGPPKRWWEFWKS